MTSGSCDKTAILWNIVSDEMLKTFQGGYTTSVLNIAISSNDGFIVTGCIGGLVKIWDCKTAQHTHTLEGHTASVTGLTLSCDDKLLFTASSDGVVKKLDLCGVPNVPGMSWNIVKPFIMVRWLCDHYHGGKSYHMRSSLSSSNMCLGLQPDAKQDIAPLRALIDMDCHDVFLYTISFLTYT